MKTIITSIIIILVFASCNPQEQRIHLTLLSDRTDDMIRLPDLGDIASVLKLEEGSHDQVSFTYQRIGNTDFSESYRLVLEGSSSLDNPLERQQSLKNFYRRIDTLLQREYAQSYDYQSSSIYIPLIRQMEALADVEAEQKIILLYSDLAELSDTYNVYTASSRRELKLHTEKVAELFTAELKNRDFSGITLYIIHYPKTPEDNRQFTSLLVLYREIFRDTGLNIIMGIDKQI